MAAVVAVGAVATSWLAMVAGMSTQETLHLAAIAGGAAATAGIAGVVAMRLLRRAPIGVQAVVVALAAIAAVAAGAAVAARAMFIAPHDLHTLAVMLSAAATVGVLFAIGLGLQMDRAVGTLRAALRRIGAGDLRSPVEGPASAELASLARELEAMSERLEGARVRERAVESARRELVAWISHDLRTPLSAIRAVAEALEDGVVEDPETVARFIRTMRQETDRLTGLVDDLFELSRINAGALILQTARVGLDELVSDAMAGASIVARRKGVRLDGRVNGGGPVVLVSPAEVGRALRNLLDNAIRHTPSQGLVQVESGAEDGRAFVSVVDQCGGIPPQDLDRVFEMAFRGQPARTPEAEAGAGLGLAIARGIAEAHHGDISVRNEGAGCRFTLRLPLEQPKT
jgi:signal transduction histidine kinase